MQIAGIIIGLMDEAIEEGWEEHHVGIALWRVGWVLGHYGKSPLLTKFPTVTSRSLNISGLNAVYQDSCCLVWVS